MNIFAKFSLRNRALIALVTVVISLFGGIAMTLLKLELIPSVTFPQLVVITSYPGASPLIVEKEVSTPIENAIQGVPGIEKTTATSQNGVSQVSVSFQYGTVIETAEQKVQLAINKIANQLPDTVSPQVIAGSFSDIPIMQLAVTSDLSTDQLNQALKDIAVKEFTRINGVRDASVFGANGQHVSIVPRANVMKRLGLTNTDIQTALQTAGIRIGAGSVSSANGDLSIVSGTPIGSLADIRSIPVPLPVSTGATGGSVSIPSIPTIPAAPRTSGVWLWDALNGGECLADYSAVPAGSYTVTSCTTAHTGQLVRIGDLRSDAGLPVYPGDAAVFGVAMATCNASGILGAGAAAAHPGLVVSAGGFPQSQAQWNKGNTYYYCYAHMADYSSFTGNVAGRKLNTITSSVSSGSSSISALTGAGATMPTSRKIVALRSIANVSIQSDPVTSISRVNGLPSLTVAITKKADSNTVEVSRAVRAELDRITGLLGNNTKFTTVFDQAPFIEKSIDSLTTEGLLGLGFAIIIILIFLLSVRSTLITAVSIPTSLLLTFIGMWASNFTLNLLTIGAVTISIGRVVDDSIVVVENIKRHLALGEERLEAILTGVKEVATAVTASTITTVAVFLPLALVSGLAGELFKPFAVTVTLALISSLFVSLTIVPVLAYWFLRGTKPSSNRATRETDAIQRAYRPIVAWTVKRPLATVLIAILTLGGTMALAPLLKTNFVGGSGQSTMTLRQSTPASLTLDQRSVVAADVEKKLLAIHGITTVQTSIGGGNSFAAFNGSSGDIIYQLTIDDAIPADPVRTEVTKDLATITNTGTIVSAQGGSFGSQDITVTVKAPSEATLNTTTNGLAAAFRSGKLADSVSTSLDDQQQYLSIEVKRAAAARKGLSEVLIGRELAAANAPTPTSTVTISDVNYNVLIEPKNAPDSEAGLRKFMLATPFGTEVKLSKVAKVVVAETAASRQTERGVLSSTITITPSSDNLSQSTAAVTKVIDGYGLPSGTTATIGGASKDQADSFAQLGLALLAAILIVYVVMVATFRSLRQPLLLLVSIPFATTGAIGLQIVSGIPLGVSSLIGLLMLVGIVVTNAIVLIDLVNQYREKGESVTDALLDGTSRRVRPVLMTALATIFALTPLATGVTGTGGFISQPLAIIVIGGLLSSTVLTLVVLPALYSLVEGAKERRAARRERRGQRAPRLGRRAKRA
jgi:HAE1 family hydrophobic/amphiphilic exporter-1